MGLAIALVIHSVDPSLSSQLILAQRVGKPNPYRNRPNEGATLVVAQYKHIASIFKCQQNLGLT